MKHILAIILLTISAISHAGEFTLMGGMSVFKAPGTGTYWNDDREYDNFMTPAAVGLRYDTEQHDSISYGIQYTHFGEVKMDAMAVLTDAPYPGGYYSGKGGCVGECAPLRRWRMRSDTQSVAFIAAKHYGKWSLEAGLNLYEVKTSGNVLSPQYAYKNKSWVSVPGTFVYQYPEARYLDVLPMFGVGYRDGPWSFHAQVWFMPAPGETPPAFNESGTATLMIGYTFK